MDLDDIRLVVQRGDTLATAHALTEAIDEGIAIADVWRSILAVDAEMIEDYSSDPRGPTCLILSFSGGLPLHSVVAYPAKRHAALLQVSAVAVLVTVYRPDSRAHEWTPDFRNRRSSP
jgi:hypothetical protein